MGNEQGSVLNREPIRPPCKLCWDKMIYCETQGREGHSSASINNKVYIYGGSGLTNLFELSVYDIEGNKWRDIRCYGENPGPLCNATLNIIGTKLYLFGGLNRETGWNNDIWSFDTDREIWEKLETRGTKPSPRDKHTAVVWGKKVVIFGGFGPATSTEDLSEESEGEGESINFTWYNDVYIFDTNTNGWGAPNVSLIGGPVPRAAHSATLYNDVMIIFGGKDSKSRNQDLFVLDLQTLEWGPFKDAGARPAPSSFHSAVQYGQFMITYGGRFHDNTHSTQLNVLDCDTGGWYAPIAGTIPPARGQCTLSVVEDGTLFMFGGSDKFDMAQQCCQEFETGMYLLDCKLLKSVEVPPPAPPTPPTLLDCKLLKSVEVPPPAMEEDKETAEPENSIVQEKYSDKQTTEQTKEQTKEQNDVLAGV